ncbi:MAG: hypothetical protein KTR13_08945 [Saprospiraceae bacterium]|nr:hypothetical protein [Saprospiraceae bacterium]
MAEEEEYRYVNAADIPTVFFSESEEQPFHTCTFCQKELIKSESHYFVEKAFRNYPEQGIADIIFEYAICIHCHQKMHESLSIPSRKAINAYFLDKKRPHEVADEYRYDAAQYLQRCVISGSEVDQLQEYQIIGEFQGDQILLSEMPILLSGAVMEEVQELLSPQTKEELDDFMDTITGLPPDLKELFKRDKVLII